MEKNNTIIFAQPSLIGKHSSVPGMVQVSITGSKCALQCRHCKARLLEAMPHADTPEKLWRLALSHHGSKGSGLLITGGSDREGRLPFKLFSPIIKRIINELDLTVIVHAGLATSEDANILASSGIKFAMTDIFGDTQLASEAMNLHIPHDGFINSIKVLIDNGIKVSPHLIAGFSGITGHEENALDTLHGLNISSLVFLSYRRIVNDLDKKHENPISPERMADLITYAKKSLNVPISLGCMKAHGRLRITTEIAALEAGIDAIALPSSDTIKAAEKAKMHIIESPLCCAIAGAFSSFNSES